MKYIYIHFLTTELSELQNAKVPYFIILILIDKFYEYVIIHAIILNYIIYNLEK